MSESVTVPATVPCAGGLVAGVDLLTESEREADALLHHVAQRLSTLGAARGSVLATHWARADDVPHVALSLEVPSAGDADRLWALLDEVLPTVENRPAARCVGGRRS